MSEEEAPKSWADLLDPTWEGQIATGHPGASGTVGVWATYMYLEKGVEYLEALADQDVLVGQSIQDTMPRVASGERLIGVSHDQSTALNMAKGDPMAIVYPDDGAVVTPAFSAITADAPHPSAGKLLADFINSEEVQSAMAEEFMLSPVIEGVTPPDYVPDDATYVRPELDEMADNLEDVIGEWRRLFGV